MNNTRGDCHKGYLYKWTNYIRGYQKRWFVLSNGLLSYYRNKNEVSHTCRGTINLSTSTIRVQDGCTIVISNDSNQTFHLKAQKENEAYQWNVALHLAKEIATQLNNADDSDSEMNLGSPVDGNSLNRNIITSDPLYFLSNQYGQEVPDISQFNKEFEQRLFDLHTSVTLVKKTGESLFNVLKDVTKMNSPHAISSNFSINSDSNSTNDLRNQDQMSVNSHSSGMQHSDSRSLQHSNSMTDLLHKFKDKNKTFYVSAQACVNSCSEFVNRAIVINSKYQKLFNNEREQRLRLEKMVEELAKQLGALEKKAAKQLESESNGTNIATPHSEEDKNIRNKLSENGSDDSGDEYFYDAIEDEHIFNVSLPRPVSQNNLKLELKYTINEYESCSSDSEYEQNNPKSNSVARVIVRSAEKKSKSTKNTDKPNSGDSTQFHRRTVSSGFPSQSHTSSPNTSRIDQTISDSSDLQFISITGDVNAFTEMKAAQSVPSLSINTESKPARVRRNKITPRPNMSINLWGIMKNCIGKELSKIPVPVNFNEPLSMIQRLTEDFEYSDCLDNASKCSDSIEQLSWVAAFTVSSYSTTTNRTGKPFNPLLGETFECDRTSDLGWRSLAEQVSHHPPAAALHCESEKGWKCWQEFTMSSKFRGKYLAIIPMGIAHLTFEKTNNHYTWRKVTSTVHNIIVGKLWIDNHGEMDIYNHLTGETCHLNYKAYSYFSKEPARRVTGVITDREGVARYVLNGTWDSYFQRAKVLQIRKDKNNQQVFETGPAETLWSRRYPPEYTSEMYNFTTFALELNEPEDGVAPTDSRLRPDQRLMEKGFWDEANKEKERLEEKQREKRKNREKELEQRKHDGLPIDDYNPVWFNPVYDEETKTTSHVYVGNYWETKASANWSPDLPDIF